MAAKHRIKPGSPASRRRYGNLGLTIATVAIAPLIAFAVVWTACLVLLTGLWLVSLL